jgi:hypothetical protein
MVLPMCGFVVSLLMHLSSDTGIYKVVIGTVSLSSTNFGLAELFMWNALPAGCVFSVAVYAGEHGGIVIVAWWKVDWSNLNE